MPRHHDPFRQKPTLQVTERTKDQEGSEKEKEKKKKGVESFGAGLEKGIAQETAEDLSEAQRHGRTQKRNKLRSASRNTFRGLTK